jgi:hypothetical protein
MEATQQDIEDLFAKKPQYVGAALKSVNFGVMAGGAVLGLFFMGGNIPLGMAVTSGINAAVSVKQEHDETQGQRISAVDQPKSKDVEWGKNGAIFAGLGAVALNATAAAVGVTFTLPVIATAVIAGGFSHFAGEAIKAGEEKELSAAQTLIENDRVNNAVNAAALGFNNNSDIVGTGQFTSANRSRKHGGNVTFQQQFLEQQAKEAELAKYATVS